MMRTSVAQEISYTCTWSTIFVSICLLGTMSSSGDALLSSSRWMKLSEDNNETIVSRGDIFELGLFKRETGVQGYWYLCIWYKRFPRSIVWVANRDKPLYTSTGILKIDNGNLVILDQYGALVWKTNQTENLTDRVPLEAELLDSGNFVLRYSSDSNEQVFLWQSFDFPSNTLLPGMVLGLDPRSGLDKILTSWASMGDPSPGRFTFRLETESGKLSKGVGWENNQLRYRTSPTFSRIFNITRIGLEETSYSLKMRTNASFYSALGLGPSGFLGWFVWTPQPGEWKTVWSVSSSQCDSYGICGPNSVCVMNPGLSCECVNGFHPIEHGCVRKSQLSCGQDVFWRLSNMKLPDTDERTSVETTSGFNECRERCRKVCHCTAFAVTNTDSLSLTCVMWTGDLLDLQSYSSEGEGQDLHVKLSAAADRGHKKNTNIKKKILVGLTVGGSGLLLLSFSILCFWKRRNKTARGRGIALRDANQTNRTEGWGSKFMEFDVIAAATNNFADSNVIGSGGFGVVYKGRLLDGKEIAVKRLTKMSTQGIQGFRNELELIGVVQHNNIVQLLGHFSDSDAENLLIYEYVENLSLDSYLFDANQSCLLDWGKRFDIINGIVRGLSYLHQDSRFRIIHLDLKPENVLLDKDMIPKISDFGMAKILQRDETEADAVSVAGTLGYMSPEYARDRVYSVKSDVFSFGVLLLEIVSGKKNTRFPRLNNGENLLSVIWMFWRQGKGLEIVDPVIKDSETFRSGQALRCIQIGLLCVQELAEDRPTMPSMALMLANEAHEISQPKQPFEVSSTEGGSSTLAHITMSTLDGR